MSKNNYDFVTATILFADLVGSSDVASIKEDNEYIDHLKIFKEIVNLSAKEITKSNTLKSTPTYLIEPEVNVKGDEGLFIFATKWTKKDTARSNAIKDDIETALKLAIRIKYEWLMSKVNIEQIRRKKKPYEIAIGINTGPVHVMKKDGAHSVEGYPINLAKRIEGESRKGEYSGIFVGENTYGIYQDEPGEDILRFKRQQFYPLKGIAGKIRVYELIFANVEDSSLGVRDRNVMVQIPSNWSDPFLAKKDSLRSLEKKEPIYIGNAIEDIKTIFNASQNPWHGNIYVNIKWKQIEFLINYLLSKGRKYDRKECKKLINEKFSQMLDVARTLIEVDTIEPVWKIYLGQIANDKLRYYNIIYGDKFKENDAVFSRDIQDILKSLTNSNPHDLDSRLCFGKLLQVFSKYAKSKEGNEKNEKHSREMLEKSLEQFRRIVVWDDEYQEAYYCEARSHAMLYNKNPNNQSIEDCLHCLKNLKGKCKNDRYQESWEGWKEDINNDDVFCLIRKTEQISLLLSK